MRFLSPSFLTFALLMSLLPWVEVRCEQRTPVPTIFRLPYAVVEQNAFQVALGDMRLANQPVRNRGQGQVQVNPDKLEKQKKEEVTASPLIAVYLGCVLVGSIAGFVIPMRRTRLIIMGVVTLGAVGTLLAQVLLGFPLLLKPLDQLSVQQLLDRMGLDDPQLRAPDIFYTSGFTIWFYLAILGTGGGAVGVLADLFNPPKPRSFDDDEDDYDRPPRRRRRRRRYEDEDDDYDDDDYSDRVRRR